MVERVAPPPTLITAGVIAERLRVPLHRVQHVLTSRPHIQPVARVGTLRVYDRQAIAMVRHELTAMDARRADRESEVQHDA